MSRNAGVYWQNCPICGKRYKRTNFMKRIGLIVPFKGEKIRLSDTHMIGCHARWLSVVPPSPEDRP